MTEIQQGGGLACAGLILPEQRTFYSHVFCPTTLQNFALGLPVVPSHVHICGSACHFSLHVRPAFPHGPFPNPRAQDTLSPAPRAHVNLIVSRLSFPAASVCSEIVSHILIITAVWRF